jgi:hypothetical protein
VQPNYGNRLLKAAVVMGFIVLLQACASDNDHFCAKYSYYHDELTKPGILPYRDIREQLRRELEDENRDPDKSRIALFVLNDIESEVIPEGEDPQQYCLRRNLWQRYGRQYPKGS